MVGHSVTRTEQPVIGHRLTRECLEIGALVRRSLLRPDDFTDGPSNQIVRLEALALEPAPECLHAPLLPVEAEDHVVDRLDEVPETLLTRLQLALGAAPIRQFPSVA